MYEWKISTVWRIHKSNADPSMLVFLAYALHTLFTELLELSFSIGMHFQTLLYPCFISYHNHIYNYFPCETPCVMVFACYLGLFGHLVLGQNMPWYVSSHAIFTGYLYAAMWSVADLLTNCRYVLQGFIFRT